ncbi:glycosyltransferase family 2 protein [Rhodococcus sp. ARC_M6]|uniref:glycosyltransferase family 2 protein n=1 Tax=Rhodococcus sp. ARC_M6 TaxID=2928852 RepID=UPI001FB43463|nr:glycosyltransferase [Rhodococcus sp. ARC_M6]MCJ0904453.1 glycosyltransferase [Rhodococcus sp. ARC_M6]
MNSKGRDIPNTVTTAKERLSDLSIVVAVLTFRRPDDLRELLPELLKHSFEAGEAFGVRQPTVLVIDNDPEGGGRDTAIEFGDGITYVHEPTPGIAAARNRALAESADFDLLVFIDDDERPTPGWLTSLLATRLRTGADGVVGPVVSTFAAPLDPWIADGGFFDRRRLPTGTEVRVAATNNLLVDLRLVRSISLEFDESFSASGGSDSLFTRRYTGAGFTLAWCDEAVVTDVVPAERATRDWVIRRRYRIGNSWARTELALVSGSKRTTKLRAALLLAGSTRVAGGTARAALGALGRNPRHRAHGIRIAARGAGIIAGAFGRTYLEYRRPAGA